jgi:hypothetical protein
MAGIFVLEELLDPSALSGAAPGTAISDWEDASGSYYISGGPVLSVPVVNPGAGYTSATVSIGAATDGSWNPFKVVATAIAEIVGGQIASIIVQTLGTGYGTTRTPTVTGNGSGAVLGPTVIHGLVLANVAGSASYSQFGAQGGLLRPAAKTTLNQRLVAEFYTPSAAYAAPPLVLRADQNTKVRLVAYWKSEFLRIYVFDDYQGGTTGTATKILEVSVPAWTIGHKYRLTATAQGTFPTRVTVLAEDVTAGTTVYSGYKDTYHAGVQTPGQMGVGVEANKVCCTSLSTYNETYITPDPDAAGIGMVGLYVGLTGVNTTFLSGANFVLSGGTGAQISGAGVSSDTEGHLLLDTGTAAGTLTITETVSGIQFQIVVSALTAPDCLASGIDSTGCTVSADEYPDFGEAPYTAQVVRSEKSGFLPTDEGVTVVATQSGMAQGAIPASQAVELPSGRNFLRWLVTDSIGTTAYGLQAPAFVPRSAQRTKIAVLGDSIEMGTGGELWTTGVIAIEVTSGGSGYETAPDVAFSSGAAEGYAVLDGDAVAYVVITAPGSYESAPTASFVGGGGSGAAGTVKIGGGGATAAKYMLDILAGPSDLEFVNVAQGGTRVAQWTPHGTGSELNAYYYLERFKETIGDPETLACVHIRLGTNDGNYNGGIPVATFQSDMALVLADIAEWAPGVPVLLSVPPFRVATTSALERANRFVERYASEALAALEREYPNALVVDDRNYDFFMRYPELLFDATHPEDVGYAALGATMALEVALALRLPVRGIERYVRPLSGLGGDWD